MFSTQFTLTFVGYFRQEYLNAFSKLNLLKSLEPGVSLIDTNDADLVIEVSNELTQFSGSSDAVPIDINTLCTCVLVEKPDILSDNSEETASFIEQYGRDQFGKITWGKYTLEEKRQAVVAYVTTNKDAIIAETGVNKLIEHIAKKSNSVLYSKNCRNYRPPFTDNTYTQIRDAINYLNSLNSFCRETLNYDPTLNSKYWTSETQVSATTGIELLDSFTRNIKSNKDISMADLLDLLTLIYDTESINRIFINAMTNKNHINDIYNEVIVSMNVNICENMTKENGAALMEMLEKTPARFSPCIGNTTEPVILQNLFTYVDYKFLQLPTVEQTVKQLQLLFYSNMRKFNKDTLYRVIYELSRARYNYHIYMILDHLESALSARNCEPCTSYTSIPTNTFCENVKAAVDHIKKLNNANPGNFTEVPVFQPDSDDEVVYDDSDDEELEAAKKSSNPNAFHSALMRSVAKKSSKKSKVPDVCEAELTDTEESEATPESDESEELSHEEPQPKKSLKKVKSDAPIVNNKPPAKPLKKVAK